MPPIHCQHVLEEFIHHPRDCSGWNLKDNASRRAAKESRQTTQSVNSLCRGHDAVDMLTVPRHGTTFLGIQQRLAHIKRCREPRGDGSGKPARQHVRQWPILAVSVEEILCELIDNKVQALVRYVEYQLCTETVVESSPAFFDENLPSTVDARPVWRSIHLESLFNHCSRTTFTQTLAMLVVT